MDVVYNGDVRGTIYLIIGIIAFSFLLISAVVFLKKQFKPTPPTDTFNKIISRIEKASKMEIEKDAGGIKSILKFGDLAIAFVRYGREDYDIQVSFCEVPVPLSREDKRLLTTKCLEIINTHYAKELSQQQETLAKL